MSDSKKIEEAYAKISQMDDYVGQIGIEFGMSTDEISSRLKAADLQAKAESLFGKGVSLEQDSSDEPLVIKNVSPDQKDAFEEYNKHFGWRNSEDGSFDIVAYDAPKAMDVFYAIDYGGDIHSEEWAESVINSFSDAMSDATQIDAYHFDIQTGQKKEQSDVSLYHVNFEHGNDLYLALMPGDVTDAGRMYRVRTMFTTNECTLDLSGNTERSLEWKKTESLTGTSDYTQINSDQMAKLRQILDSHKNLIKDHEVDVCYGMSENNEKKIYLVADGKAAETSILHDYEGKGEKALTHGLMSEGFVADDMIDFLENRYENVLNELDFSFQSDQAGRRTIAVHSELQTDKETMKQTQETLSKKPLLRDEKLDSDRAVISHLSMADQPGLANFPRDYSVKKAGQVTIRKSSSYYGREDAAAVVVPVGKDRAACFMTNEGSVIHPRGELHTVNVSGFNRNLKVYDTSEPKWKETGELIKLGDLDKRKNDYLSSRKVFETENTKTAEDEKDRTPAD